MRLFYPIGLGDGSFYIVIVPIHRFCNLKMQAGAIFLNWDLMYVSFVLYFVFE
jgi:hypothetical protein